jgi:hypothetical protein
VASNLIVANPDKYESTLLVIVKGGFNPLPGPTDVLKGDKLLNDGFADLTLHTEANCNFANNPAPFLANFTGIIFNTQVQINWYPIADAQSWSDIVVLSSTSKCATPSSSVVLSVM